MKELNVLGTELKIKEWKFQRVVTLSDVDKVHQRPDGTAHRTFKQNKFHFVANEDYYIIKPGDFLKDEIRPLGFDDEKPSNRGTIYLTESGYLMIVKSFTDPLAWDVQKMLVKSYFKLKNIASDSNEVIAMEKHYATVQTKIEGLEEAFQDQSKKLDSVMDNMTISTRQQEKIHKAVKDRVNVLLGGCTFR